MKFSDADNLAYLRAQSSIIEKEAVELDYDSQYSELIPVSTQGNPFAAAVVFASNAAVLLTKSGRTVAVLAAPAGDRFAASVIARLAGATVVSRRTTGLALAVDAPLSSFGVAGAVVVCLTVWVAGFTASLQEQGTEQRR